MSDPAQRLVDARGLHCPAPVIRLAAAADGAPPGTVLTVWWTDPAAEYDIPAWARLRGHTVVGTAPVADEGPAGPAQATTVRLGQAKEPPHAVRRRNRRRRSGEGTTAGA